MTIVKVLDGPVAGYIPSTGLMTVSTGVKVAAEILFGSTPDAGQREDPASYIHECIHHIQVLSSSYLWKDAIARIDLAKALLYPRAPGRRTTAITEIARRERAWRYRAFGVSVRDLCEGGAVLESYKSTRARPCVGDFLRWRDFAFPGKGNSPYRRTFDILSDQCGQDAAFDLLPVITLLALQGDIPGRSFEMLVADSAVKSGSLTGETAEEIVGTLGFSLSLFANLTPEVLARFPAEYRHPTLYPTLCEACQMLGSSMLETMARPHRAMLPPVNELLVPPLIVGAHQLGANVMYAVGVAKRNKNLRLNFLDYTAIVTASKKIVMGSDDFIPCPHVACADYDAGLCAGNLVPPADPEYCAFRAQARESGGKELHEIAAECAPLVQASANSGLRSATDLATLFPGAETMANVVDDDSETCAGRFDRQNLLDPEDNDVCVALNCQKCQILWQEWASRRKMNLGFTARCPECGASVKVGRDQVTYIQVDN